MPNGRDEIIEIFEPQKVDSTPHEAQAGKGGQSRRPQDYGATASKSGPQDSTRKPLPESEFDLSGWNPWTQTGAPAFPVDALPETARRFVIERSEMTGSDISAYAMCALVAVSAAVDHRVILKPKKHDPHYSIHPVLWVLLCGDPSTRKSAPIGDVADMLRRYDRHDAKARAERVKALIEGGTDEAKAEKQIPRARRRVIYDTTTEKLCDILAHQNCGVGLFRDELSGWIGAMDKYGGGGRGASQDRSVWLAAFGSRPYAQDRQNDSREIEMLSATILGGIQPDRLKEMGPLESDGLLQRFAPVVMAQPKPDKDEPVDPAAWEAFDNILGQLGRMAIPTVFHLCDEARTIYLQFSHKMSNAAKLQEPSPAFGAFLGKQARTLGAICLLLHVVDVVEGRLRRREDDVPVETISRALRIVEDFVIPHAWQFYASINVKWARSVHQLAAALIKCAGQWVTQSAINRKCAASRDMNLQEFQKAMIPFQVNGWAIAEETGPLNRYWAVNPALAGRFDDEMREHQRLHEEIVEKARKKGKRS